MKTSNLIKIWVAGFCQNWWKCKTQVVLDQSANIIIYYGDNQRAGRDILDTKLGGNLILQKSFELACSNNIVDRKKIPPFSYFKKMQMQMLSFLDY